MKTFYCSQEIIDFACYLADEAKKITQSYFRHSLKIELKNDQSPVTIADKAVESHLRQLIRVKYPNHAIIGEEEAKSGESDWYWIIDPIDGTKSFLSGFPVYCTLIALYYKDIAIINLIDMPILNERFIAADNEHTTLNGQRINTSKTTELDKVLAYSTDPKMFNVQQISKIQPLINEIAQYRYTGDGYLYAMLAAGWIDLVIEADMKPYDYLPLKLIVEKAGGVITDWKGQTLTLDSNGEILASANPRLHQQALIKINSL